MGEVALVLHSLPIVPGIEQECMKKHLIIYKTLNIWMIVEVVIVVVIVPLLGLPTRQQLITILNLMGDCID